MVSIYQRIFTDIETKIISGIWRPGDCIPVERELVAQYQCSRMTVSKALSALAERGMIVRRRKTGSFVASPQIDRTVMDIQDISTEAELAGHEHHFEILARKIERLGEVEAQQLSEAADAEVLRLQCLHIVDGRPNAIERRIIMLDAVPRAREESFASTPPGKWLLQEVPWSKAKHVIRAVSADSATARILQTEKGEACLSLVRQTWQNGRTVTYVEFVHPGDRFQFAGTFHPMAN
ncbi:GntR family histidine utilization transcriptional repressor [Rhizobium sp. BK591]|uniref:UTRA domain-containing protein n=1 Tax=Rhizobium anhuiense TaxID=1184720 RepID=A0A3S0QHF0_9HYPH|nr:MULTISPECIES: UTRA domain-containing protein [Rhizobium]MBB3300144.1 GntR family histidine utilization transcriptional repressor [Rhizobium sp. BK112]MBB3369601.1 GntR family histidine utilization transcriptional repressor [Rhizobium sp. BK077]MBB3742764.1 GntR family histidine utilization transcriptional repressor [Rhizobium sp. BK591]MBB4179854.1 GntR family histidine utilization transcriptional repressor [Rhizobium sp. BK109]MBB4213147.1 GntR family histidine utilization transcriptional 